MAHSQCWPLVGHSLHVAQLEQSDLPHLGSSVRNGPFTMECTTTPWSPWRLLHAAWASRKGDIASSALSLVFQLITDLLIESTPPVFTYTSIYIVRRLIESFDQPGGNVFVYRSALCLLLFLSTVTDGESRQWRR